MGSSRFSVSGLQSCRNKKQNGFRFESQRRVTRLPSGGVRISRQQICKALSIFLAPGSMNHGPPEPHQPQAVEAGLEVLASRGPGRQQPGGSPHVCRSCECTVLNTHLTQCFNFHLKTKFPSCCSFILNHLALGVLLLLPLSPSEGWLLWLGCPQSLWAPWYFEHREEPSSC